MSADSELIDEIRENRQTASAEWDEIQAEGKKDKLCIAGQPWAALDPDGLRERKDNKRPFLALDELGQYINQTVNDVRANPRGIKYAPTGNGANDAGAEFYQNHTREIEYRSHARVADSHAFEDMVTSGVGWLRIRTKRSHIRTFDQDLWVEPVMNAEQILPDSNAVWPDSRDAKFLYYIEPWTRKEFERRFPKAKKRDFNIDVKIAPQWVSPQNIQVAEYWKIHTVTRKLVAYRARSKNADQSIIFKLRHELPDGKLPPGTDNLREEDVEDTSVKAWLTNGLEVLDEIQWKGKYLPFVSCIGKTIYVDEGSGSRRQIMSMTRLARDPYMLYCYIRTCEAEAIGGVPRATWVGYKGQFAKPERWIEAGHKPVAFLEAEVSVPNNPTQSPLPLPTKEPWDPPLQNLDLAAEAARRAIQAAFGITPMPTNMQRDDPRLSGAGMDKLASSGQKGSFHYVDAYELMIERRGEILEDLMDKVLDTARNVPVRKQDDSATTVRINDPRPNAQNYAGNLPAHTQAMDAWKARNPNEDDISTKGDYRVTISTGPATDSQRQDGSDYVDGLMQNIEQLAQLAGPQKALMILAKSIKLKTLGPIGDEIADILSPPMPGKNGKPMSADAQALMGEIQQLKSQLQQAQQSLQSKQAEIQAKTAGDIAVVGAKAKADLAKTQITTAATSADKQADREVKLGVAAIEAKTDHDALLVEESKLVGARAGQGATMTHEHDMAVRDRLHQSTESAKDRLHEHIQGQIGHEQAKESAQQQADLAPDPATDGNSE